MTAERPYYIYCHTAPNGKRYIGQTCQSPSIRWSHGKGYKNNEYFTHAINKYGWDSFTHDILCVVHYKSIADLFEQYYIEKYDTFNDKHGYNLTKGGGGRVGYKMSEAERKQLGNRMRGRAVSEETRRRISETLKEGYRTRRIAPTKHSKETLERMSREHTGEGNPMYGRHHSKEAAKRIGDYHRGKKHSEEWKRKISESRYKSTKIKRCPVDQYDFDGNLLGHYESLKDAEEKTGFAASNIRNCARGKYKQAYGFIWRYADEAA